MSEPVTVESITADITDARLIAIGYAKGLPLPASTLRECLALYRLAEDIWREGGITRAEAESLAADRLGVWPI